MWNFFVDGPREAMEYFKDPSNVRQAVTSIMVYVGAFVLACLAQHSRSRLRAMAKRRAERREEANVPQAEKPWGILARSIYEALMHPGLCLTKGETKPGAQYNGLELPGRLGVILKSADGCDYASPIIFLSGDNVSDELENHELHGIATFAKHRFEVLCRKDKARRHAEWSAKLRGKALVSEPIEVGGDEVCLGDCQPDADKETGEYPVVTKAVSDFNRRYNSTPTPEQLDGKW